MIRDGNGNVLIYDAFCRQNTLFLVSSYIGLNLTNFEELDVVGTSMTEHGRNEYEPARYFSGRMPATGDDGCIEIKVNGTKHRICVDMLSAGTEQHHDLAFCTLFKNESPQWIEKTLNVYRAQGVKHFFLYFNGRNLPETAPKVDDVTYVLWDYPYYRNGGNNVDRWRHEAQMTFLTSAKLRYGPRCKWLIAADLDEWIVPTNATKTLLQYLNGVSPQINVVQVKNHWASAAVHGNSVEYNRNGNPFNERSKCIYRDSFTGLFGIHRAKQCPGKQLLQTEDLIMFHVVDCLHPERKNMVYRDDNHTQIILG